MAYGTCSERRSYHLVELEQIGEDPYGEQIEGEQNEPILEEWRDNLLDVSGGACSVYWSVNCGVEIVGQGVFDAGKVGTADDDHDPVIGLCCVSDLSEGNRYIHSN